MPKLPDYTSLGQSPTPRTGLGKVSYKATHGNEALPGQAVSKIGQAIGQLTDDIDKENLRVDTIVAEDAFNKLRSKQMDLSAGEQGYSQKKGSEAIHPDFIKDYTKKFDDSVNEVVNGLTNDRQKALLRSRANISALQYKQDIVNHVTREKDSFAKATFQGILDTETSNAIERYRDPNGTALSLERINAAITNEAERTGAAPELVQAMRRDASSKVNRGIIERHLANDDDLSATAQYKQIKGSLNSEDTIAVERALEVGSTRGQAQRLADKFMAKHDNNFGLAVEEARKIKNPKVREAALGNIRQAKSDNEAAIKLNEDDAFTSAMQVVQQYGDVNKIPPDTLVRIGVDGQNTLAKMALEVREKRTPTTDIKVWSEFSEKAKDRNWLSGLSEKEFSNYLFSFDEEKRDRASALRDAATKAAQGDAKAKDFLRNDLNLGEMVKAKVFNAGIIDPTKKPSQYKEDEKKLLSDIELQASKALEDFQTKNKRKATTQEEEDVVRGLLLPHLKVRVERDYWYDPEKRMGELTQEELGKAYVEYDNVPTEDRTFLATRANALGIKDVGEDRIAKAYTAILKSTVLPSAHRRAMIDAILRGK